VSEASEPSSIEREYVRKHPGSQRLYRRALRVFPRGVTHDGRYMRPFPIHCVRAEGSRKWDVDGNEYVDYWMGHGALLLGHLHPAVTKAVLEQAEKGTHYGASQELEIEWAEKVTRLVPSARGGLVEFTSSGTEATMMALRIARAYTGREKIVRLAGHFHGWNDYVAVGYSPPFDRAGCSGIPRGTVETVEVVPPNNVGAVEEAVEGGDVAGLILEPGGGSMGFIPSSRGYLGELRRVTRENGVLLIFDEVVTGFRDAPGGTQERLRVTPDLTALGKIVAGGYPGGAVAGKGEYMEMLGFRDGDPEWNTFRRIPHPGTYNANPLCAAAGNACLGVIAEGKVHPYVNRLGERLRAGLGDVLEDRGVRGIAWGETSIILLALGASPEDLEISSLEGVERMKGIGSHPAHGALVKAMINRGVHLMGPRAILSAAHTEEDIQKTVEALDSSLREMDEEGLLRSFH